MALFRPIVPETPSVFIASDHAGYVFKSMLCTVLREKQYVVTDLGTTSEEVVDYPAYAHRLAAAVAQSPERMGVLLCGTGNGMAMVANKHPGIRAALCWDREMVRLTRKHNQANVLCLPARFIDPEESKALLLLFLQTPFEGGRHTRRVEQIPLFPSG